ncbi:phosphatase domain-containing protein [Nocardia puris]|uniref:Putative kinase n=1 Tax=Nocardia puris TaxID=208602 RepID=A0A366DML5_9NOCA|nr:AAA family ATPase [Nocardia puris]RBO91330.1 putative kinase [Nocardia puris]
MQPQQLAILRGPQGAGKTRRSRQLVRETPNTVRIGRDDMRRMALGRTGVLEREHEDLITAMMRGAAEEALRQGAHVVIDATHLVHRHAQGWADFAAARGAEFVLHDMATPFADCVANDEARALAGRRSVGPELIAASFRRWPPEKWKPVVPAVDRLAITPYEPDPTLPPAWIVDLDGTLADNRWRDPYDYNDLRSDPVIAPTRSIVNALAGGDSLDSVIILSGRDACTEEDTIAWLEEHHILFDELHMRTTGDRRPDALVKLELFDTALRETYNVLGVIDDRLAVVRMWHRLGLTVFRAGDPDATH